MRALRILGPMLLAALPAAPGAALDPGDYPDRTLRFDGVIFSDDLSMAAAVAVGPAPVRVRRALEAGADMALVCNDPDAAGETLTALSGYLDPAAHARLVAMRAQVSRQHLGELRERPEWQRASAQLAAALHRPPFELHG